jgi:hypothetical protein
MMHGAAEKMIGKCGFGKMEIDGRVYRSDLLILPGGEIADGWRRIRGHRLVLEDIQRLLPSRPQIIVAGTGIFGRMRIDPALERYLTNDGIELIAQPTKSAARRFNDLIDDAGSVAGCFHLTC